VGWRRREGEATNDGRQAEVCSAELQDWQRTPKSGRTATHPMTLIFFPPLAPVLLFVNLNTMQPILFPNKIRMIWNYNMADSSKK
jgi:hypothetical protein